MSEENLGPEAGQGGSLPQIRDIVTGKAKLPAANHREERARRVELLRQTAKFLGVTKAGADDLLTRALAAPLPKEMDF